MIGKIIGGIAGSKAADHIRGINEPGGALLGIGAATLARRLSLPAMLAIAAGGYALKRHKNKEAKRKAAPSKVKPSAA